jgi:hypothetical protein
MEDFPPFTGQCSTARRTQESRLRSSQPWAGDLTLAFSGLSFPYRGRRCYRVFWGHYETSEEAGRAIHEIPEVLRGSSQGVVVREPHPFG